MKTSDDSFLRSNSPQRLIKRIITALAVIAIVFNILTLFFALRWAQAPFLGAFLYPRLVVADSYNPDWNAHRLGLQSGERILAINDAPVSSGRDLVLLLDSQETSNSVVLRL